MTDKELEEARLREKLGIDVAEEILASRFVLRKDRQYVVDKIKADLNKETGEINESNT